MTPLTCSHIGYRDQNMVEIYVSAPVIGNTGILSELCYAATFPTLYGSLIDQKYNVDQHLDHHHNLFHLVKKAISILMA